MRSKSLALTGGVVLIAAVLVRGGIDLWLAGQADLLSAAPNRPWPIAFRRVTVHVGTGLWWLRQGLSAAIALGAILALWGGWPRRGPEGPR